MSSTHGNGSVIWLVLIGAVCVSLAGCGDPIVRSGIAHPGKPQGQSGSTSQPDVKPVLAASDASAADAAGDARDNAVRDSTARDIANRAAEPAVPVDPARPREFPVEGTDGALRISFDDLDLMKLINMDVITLDCADKMPEWLKGLSGKKVRIRGFMKPVSVTEGLPAFPFVRSTDMCCFGPKGKVYHMIDVTLKPGLTTDYIELKPFDVEGTLRIEVTELGEIIIFIYHIDDAAIVRS